MFVDRRHRHRRVVDDKHIESAVSRDDPLDEIAGLPRIAQVRREGPAVMGSAGHGHPIRLERRDDRPAQTARGTGDERDWRGIVHWMTVPPFGEYTAPVVN